MPSSDAVWPCTLDIIPPRVVDTHSTARVGALGVQVAEGVVRLGTPLCVPSRGGLYLGRIASIELDDKAVVSACAGQQVVITLDGSGPTHFDHTDQLVSLISRESIDALKRLVHPQPTKEDWRLILRLKKMFLIE
jgi:translation initiation factor 5B